jgi:hypothetical protein
MLDYALLMYLLPVDLSTVCALGTVNISVIGSSGSLLSVMCLKCVFTEIYLIIYLRWVNGPFSKVGPFPFPQQLFHP